MESVIGFLFIYWVILSVVAGGIGLNRRIGFGGAFGLSLLFSPFVGIIITCLSPRIEDMNYKEAMLKNQVTLSKFILEQKEKSEYGS